MAHILICEDTPKSDQVFFWVDATAGFCEMLRQGMGRFSLLPDGIELSVPGEDERARVHFYTEGPELCAFLTKTAQVPHDILYVGGCMFAVSQTSA